MPAVVAGVDCHKGLHVVAVLDEVGRVVAELTVDDPDEFQRVFDAVQQLGAVIWGLESTGSYGRNMLGRRRTGTMRSRLTILGDGPDLDHSLTKSIRVELDDEHGVDTSAFYDGDADSPSEFVARYRKLLRRLGRL